MHGVQFVEELVDLLIAHEDYEHLGVEELPVAVVLLQYVEVLQQLVDVSLLYLLAGHSVSPLRVKVILQVIFLAQHSYELVVHVTGVLEQLPLEQEQLVVVVVPPNSQSVLLQLPRQVFDSLQVSVSVEYSEPFGQLPL